MSDIKLSDPMVRCSSACFSGKNFTLSDTDLKQTRNMSVGHFLAYHSRKTPDILWMFKFNIQVVGFKLKEDLRTTSGLEKVIEV